MGIATAIIGSIAGLAAIYGVVVALDLTAPLLPGLGWTFWFSLAGILFLGTIALQLGRGENYD
ncbi:hypothetical protein ACFLTW_04755 [Chloroflexota bacterium]